MKDYEITVSETSLVIRRRKGPAIVPLLFFGSWLCLMLVVPLANIFIYHYLIWVSIWLAVIVMLFFLPLLIGTGRLLGRKTIILDKRQNHVLVNGRRVCALTDVRGVKLGTYIVPTAKDRPFKIRGLYLETAEGAAVEIERATSFGSNYKEVGMAIADFAQVKSNLP